MSDRPPLRRSPARRAPAGSELAAAICRVLMTHTETGFGASNSMYELALTLPGDELRALVSPEAEFRVYINDSDFFAWGYAGAFEVDDPEALERVYVDCEAVDAIAAEFYAPYLYCARKAKNRPQGACYPHDRRFWALFDACGPEREVGPGNPHAPGAHKAGEVDYFGCRPPAERQTPAGAEPTSEKEETISS